MFIADMIAPCGLDCSICKRALAETGRCAGCRGPNDNKPEFCSERCGIILCEKRKSNGYSFCDECPDFPCADVMEKETRYGSQYPLREFPLENLRFMEWQTSFSLLSRIIIRTQSGSMKETAISKLGKFQTCTVPESQNT